MNGCKARYPQPQCGSLYLLERRVRRNSAAEMPDGITLPVVTSRAASDWRNLMAPGADRRTAELDIKRHWLRRDCSFLGIGRNGYFLFEFRHVLMVVRWQLGAPVITGIKQKRRPTWHSGRRSRRHKPNPVA